ncbi:MAG TPA: hypothetical protein VFP84_31080 [Kofleriaceae bacterium]|nr:hypothetical protein [Kofleriaceae bacterium]
MTASVTGCYSDITASTRTYLGPTGSGAVVGRPLRDTVGEVTRLFQARGYALLEQRIDAPNGERRLKFATPMKTVDDTSIVQAKYVGSVFYAWVTPDAAGTGTTVSLLGKPTLAGAEPCTHDGVALVCSQVTAPRAFADRYLRAHTELEVVHAVLDDLTREGFAVHALPADAPAPTPDSATELRLARLAECRAARDYAVPNTLTVAPDGSSMVVAELPRCY